MVLRGRVWGRVLLLGLLVVTLAAAAVAAAVEERIVGCNIFWLRELDSAWPTEYQVEDALHTAKEMGANVVRSHTFGMAYGDPLGLEPELDVWNDDVWEIQDLVLHTAAKLGLQVIVPGTDNWYYYVQSDGTSANSRYTWCSWYNISSDACQDEFYTREDLIEGYERYLERMVTHVNVYSGLEYREEPTIWAWETGNELNSTVEWTQRIAQYMRDSLGVTQPIIDGRDEVRYGSSEDFLSIPETDIVTDHFYPLVGKHMDVAHANAANATAAGKGYLVGEYDWTTGDLESALEELADDPNVLGHLFWSLFSHDNTYGFVQHDDGFTVHWPGDDQDMRRRVEVLREQAFAFRGISPPPPPSAPLQPLITSYAAATQSLAWRGATLADRYDVERSYDAACGVAEEVAGVTGDTCAWERICAVCATDNDTPWVDACRDPTLQAFYRVRGHAVVFSSDTDDAAAAAGAPGPWSDVFVSDAHSAHVN